MSKCAELTDLSLMALSQHNQQLNTLEVSGCRNFTDIGFQALARNCKYLERMDLEECSQITDLTLAHLAIGCPSLEKLVSCHLKQVTVKKDIYVFAFCFVDPLALRANNGRWYTPFDLGQLCCGESLGAGTGQLSLDHRSHA